MIKKTYVKSRKIYKVTFEVPPEQFPEGVEVTSMHLVGDFNGWAKAATLMKRRSKSAPFRVTVELEPGRGYAFRYLINGEIFCNAWEADAYAPGDFGEDNSIITLDPAA